MTRKNPMTQTEYNDKRESDQKKQCTQTRNDPMTSENLMNTEDL